MYCRLKIYLFGIFCKLFDIHTCNSMIFNEWEIWKIKNVSKIFECKVKVEDIVISDYCFSEFFKKDMDSYIIEYYILLRDNMY